MHVPQVRNERRGGKTRRALHSSAQHCQRKDLHLLVVLAPPAGGAFHPRCNLSARDNPFAADEGIPALHSIPADQEGSGQYAGQEEQDGGLVPLLHARTECGQYDIQGSDARAG